MEATRFIKAQGGKNLRKSAYDAIKESICSNIIKPGDLLSENQIAQELGMSRTPVREALRMLASEDYLEVRDGIGIYVKPVSYKDIQDIFQVRKCLEILAAQTAINFISPSDVNKLEERFLHLLSISETDPHVEAQEFTDIDLALHELIVERCGNKYVKNVMQSINSNIKRFQSMSFQALGDLRESTQQHLVILRLLRDRDYPQLAAALESHIKWSEKCLLGKMQDCL